MNSNSSKCLMKPAAQAKNLALSPSPVASLTKINSLKPSQNSPTLKLATSTNKSPSPKLCSWFLKPWLPCTRLSPLLLKTKSFPSLLSIPIILLQSMIFVTSSALTKLSLTSFLHPLSKKLRKNPTLAKKIVSLILSKNLKLMVPKAGAKPKPVSISNPLWSKPIPPPFAG